MAELNLLSKAEKAVEVGEALGASEVEAYVRSVDSKRIILTSGIETIHASYTSGLGARVIMGNRIGFFASSSLAIRDIKTAVKTAYSIAKLNEPDKDWISLPTKSRKAKAEGVFDKEVAEIEPSMLVEGAAQMLDAVKKGGEKLSITGGDVSVAIVMTAIVTSHGCSLCREETYASASINVKAEEEGLKGLSGEDQQSRNWRGLDCSSIAETAAKRASKVIHAKPIASGKMPVIWDNKLFASVLSIMFGGTFSADSVQKGRSPWIRKAGKRIASENFTLIDDGLLKNGLGTREFDDDGIPQQRVTLINRGILQGFLYDNYTANKDKRESTGNSSRNYQSPPIPSPNNLSLQPGKVKREELLEDVKRGLYLVETIGEWLSNPISGDLSATATNAFLIEDGELTKPVKGIIVSGDFFDILNGKINLVADDVENAGSTYSPSVRISEMTLAGE